MKTFYTKCGIEFKKSSSAMVTGYTDPDNPKCEKCPFRLEVFKLYPAVHDKWECRAGSRPPNQKSEWQGSLKDKNSMHIWSLDHELMESIKTFCREHPELGASYNQDLDDCRRILSISCSANKKGMAAKKELVDKFFGDKQPEEIYQGEYCTSCASCLDEGESVEYRKCTKKRSFVTIKQKACDKFEKFVPKPDDRLCPYYVSHKEDEAFIQCRDMVNTRHVDWIKPKEDGDLQNRFFHYTCRGTYYACALYVEMKAKDEKKEDASNVNCNTNKCGFNNEAGGCGFEPKDTDNKVFTEYAQEAIKLGCTNDELKQAFHSQPCLSTSPKKPRSIISEVCEKMRDYCPCFCDHNDGCAVRLITGDALKSYLENISKEKWFIDCDIYKKIYEKHFPVKEITEEVIMELVKPEDRNLDGEKPQSFDYSLVDTDTATFLQEKEAKITQIRMMSVISIGKELKEAQDKLASHNKNEGIFVKWIEASGIKKSTAYDYMRVYEYVVRNSENIIEPENIQPSLLLAMSKPSAPAELQQAVIDGDITTHKQYKELEAQLKAREQEKEFAEDKAQRAEDSLSLSRSEIKNLSKSYQALREQLSNTQEPVEVQELRDKLTEAERQVNILTDELMKPVDITPAVVEKEVERSADKDFEYVAEFLGKFVTVHTGQLKNWARVLGENNNRHDLEGIKQNLIALNRNIGNMMDAIDEEISNK